MNPDEIKKSLKCCINGDCGECPLNTKDCSEEIVMDFALAYINQLEAEADKIAEDYSNLMIEKDELFDEAEKLFKNAKAEAIKEFWNKLKTHSRKMQSSDFSGEFWDRAVLIDDGDNLVKEMAGDDK